MRSIPGVILGFLLATWMWTLIFIEPSWVVGTIGLLLLISPVFLVASIRADNPYLGILTGVCVFVVIVLFLEYPTLRKFSSVSAILGFFSGIFAMESFLPQPLSRGL